MNDINLDDLMKKKDDLNQVTTVDEAEVMEVVKAESSQELSEADRAVIEKIKNEIDLTESQTPTLYAKGTQKTLGDFSSGILANIKNSDLGSSGQLLSNLLATIENFDVASMEDPGFFASIFRKSKSKIQAIFSKYEVVENQVDKIVNELEISQNVLLKDIVMYDKLYDENLQYFKELNLYIIAGEEKAKEMRAQLPKLQQDALEKNDPMAVQVVKDFEGNLARFEKKLHDLKTTKMIAIQTAPEIKMIQNNNNLLMDKINETISNTIPLWKSQMIISLGLEHQGRIAEMQKEISDTTNKMLRQNADKLKQNTIAVAKEAERSIVDIDAVKYANNSLIETIKESIKIHEDARTARQKAEGELVQLENNLKETMMGVIEQGGRKN